MSDAEKIAQTDEFKTIQKWRAQIWAEGYAAAREQAATLIDDGFARPVGTPHRDDGVSSKNDKCPHDRVMYEDCEACCSAAIRKMEPNPPRPNPRAQPVTTAVRLSHTQGGPNEALDTAPTETPGEGLAA